MAWFVGSLVGRMPSQGLMGGCFSVLQESKVPVEQTTRTHLQFALWVLNELEGVFKRYCFKCLSPGLFGVLPSYVWLFNWCLFVCLLVGLSVG